MTKISMTAKDDKGTSQATPGQQPPTSVTMQAPQQVSIPGVGTLASVRGEIDDAYDDMSKFMQMEPDQIMRICAGHTSRLNEIRTCVYRVEDFIRQLKPVRTNEIEPTIKELQFQFQVASRLFAVRQLDWEMVRGSGT